MRPRPLLAAALLLVSSGWHLAAVGAPAGPPEVFDVVADGAPVLTEAALPAAVPLVLATGLGRSSVTMNSQPNALSQAAIGYSPAAESVPVLFGLSALADQGQFWCYSYFPGEPRQASCGAPVQDRGVFRLKGGSGHTVTTGDSADSSTLRSESSVVVAGVTAPGLPLAVAVGKMVSSAAVGADGTRMAGRASAAFDDLAVGNALRVGTLRSRVAGALGGTPGSGTVERDFVISGAEVGGVPVTIDGQGVRVAGVRSSPLLAELQRRVNDVLVSAGLTVRTVPVAGPTMPPEGTSLQVSSGGLLLTFTRSEGAFSLVLGQSNLQMAASRPQQPAAIATDDGPPPVVVPMAPPARGPRHGSTAVHHAAEPTPRPAPSPAFVGTRTTESPSPAGRGRLASAPVSRPPPADPPDAPRWTIPYTAFALLALSLPLLAQARRLVLFAGGRR